MFLVQASYLSLLLHSLGLLLPCSDAAAGCSHPFRTTKAKCAFSPAIKWRRTQALPRLKEAHFQGPRAQVGLYCLPGTFIHTLWSGAPLQRCPWPSALPVLWDELPVHDFYPLTCCLGGIKKKTPNNNKKKPTEKALLSCAEANWCCKVAQSVSVPPSVLFALRDPWEGPCR